MDNPIVQKNLYDDVWYIRDATTIEVIKYWAGWSNGRCLQIKDMDSDSQTRTVNLNLEQAKELAKILNEFIEFEEAEKEYEKERVEKLSQKN